MEDDRLVFGVVLDEVDEVAVRRVEQEDQDFLLMCREIFIEDGGLEVVHTVLDEVNYGLVDLEELVDRLLFRVNRQGFEGRRVWSIELDFDEEALDNRLEHLNHMLDGGILGLIRADVGREPDLGLLDALREVLLVCLEDIVQLVTLLVEDYLEQPQILYHVMTLRIDTHHE